MARTRRLEDMRNEVRDRADIENSQHITDAQINRYINQSGAALHAILVEHCEDEFIELFSGTTSAASGNLTSISLGAVPEESNGAYKIVAVELEVSGRRRHIERWSWQTHGALIDQSNSGSLDFRYRWVSYTLQIIPGCPTATPYWVYAIPPFVDLTDDDDTLDGRDGWEEWIVIDAAVKCLLKEESDTRPLVAERTEVLERVKSQMKARDFARPDRVQDTERRSWYDNDTVRAGTRAPS